MKISRETADIIEEANQLVTHATRTMNTDNFRAAKNKQNIAKKMIEKDRVEDIKRNLNSNKKWKTIKEERAEEQKIPTRVVINGKEESSPKLLQKNLTNISKVRLKISEKVSCHIQTRQKPFLKT